jgi:hypothetical protein
MADQGAPAFIPAQAPPQTNQASSANAPAFIPVSKEVAAKLTAPPESSVTTGVGDTLGREIKSFAQTLNPVNIAKSAYHAAADPVTADEKAQFGKDAYKDAGPAGRLLGRTIVAPIMTAGKYYKDVAQGKRGDASAVETEMLENAPEAIGQAGGTVVGGKLIDSAGKVIKGGAGADLAEGAEGPARQPRADIAKQEFGSKTVDIAKAAPGAVADAAGAVKDKVVDVAAKGVEHGKNIVSRASTPKSIATGAATLGLPGIGHAVGPAVGTLAEIVMGKERANTPLYKPSVEAAEAPDATGENKPFAGESGEGRSRPNIAEQPKAAEPNIAEPVRGTPKNLKKIPVAESAKPVTGTPENLGGVKNIAEPVGESAKPNIGKQVGIRDESKAARAMQEKGSKSEASLGQFAQVNGTRLEDAIAATEGEKYGSNREVRNAIHDISAKNGDLVRVADKLKVDVSDLGKMDRKGVFTRMLDAGHSPEDIAEAYRSIKP